LDGFFTNEFSGFSGEDYVAENGMQYAIIKIKISIEDGKWNCISSFDFKKAEVNQNTLVINKELTEKINGKDIFINDTREAQEVSIVYELSNEYTDISLFTLQIVFTDGGSTALFAMQNCN